MEHKFKYILAIDPSGNFHEGKGTTGWVLIDEKEKMLDSGVIKAEQYRCPEEYWNAHLNLLEYYYEKYEGDLIVVMEDYILYKNRSYNQTNSQMETCRVLGVMLWWCWKVQQPYKLQRATEVKLRWADDVLEREGTLERRGRYYYHSSGEYMGVPHKRDALRHAIHFAVCRNDVMENTKRKGVRYHARSNYKSR